MAKCISNLKNKAALDTQKGASLGLKCVRMRLAAGLCPDPLGKLEHSPRPWEGRGMGGRGGRERADPRPGLRKCKGGNPKVWGPPTMPEENRGP